MGLGAPLERRKVWSGGRSFGHHLHRAPVCGISEGAGRAATGGDRGQLKRARRQFAFGLIAVVATAGLVGADKLSIDERMEIERGLTAEYAIAKVSIPQSKKPLVVHPDGTYDKSEWQDAMYDGGMPSARVGDQLQITRVQIEGNKIVLEINGGTRGKGHWYDHVQIGMAGPMTPVSSQQTVQQEKAHGTYIALVFPKSVPSITSAQIRQILSPLFNFDRRSATEQYVERLPEPIQKAIKSQKAIVGMDRDQVLLALGKPHGKSRETDKDGNDIEDWIYGDPPGKMTFVRFVEGKVVRVEDSYANIGGTTAPPLPSVQ